MEAVVHGGPISRASIARQTGLSKQTTSEIARILEQDGWIRETGRTSGHVGRMAATYEVVPDSACIAAVDLGGTKTRAAIADLSCRILAEEVEPTDARGGRHVARQIARMCRTAAKRHRIPFERVRLAVAGVPGVPEPGSGRILMAPNIPRLDTFDFASELEDALGMEVHLDNDVNLAVLGENWLGSGHGADHLAFIALGTGIGAGLVLGGQLVRGAGGKTRPASSDSSRSAATPSTGRERPPGCWKKRSRRTGSGVATRSSRAGRPPFRRSSISRAAAIHTPPWCSTRPRGTLPGPSSPSAPSPIPGRSSWAGPSERAPSSWIGFAPSSRTSLRCRWRSRRAPSDPGRPSPARPRSDSADCTTPCSGWTRFPKSEMALPPARVIALKASGSMIRTTLPRARTGPSRVASSSRPPVAAPPREAGR